LTTPQCRPHRGQRTLASSLTAPCCSLQTWYQLLIPAGLCSTALVEYNPTSHRIGRMT
jgi:hypothetical protein